MTNHEASDIRVSTISTPSASASACCSIFTKPREPGSAPFMSQSSLDHVSRSYYDTCSRVDASAGACGTTTPGVGSTSPIGGDRSAFDQAQPAGIEHHGGAVDARRVLDTGNPRCLPETRPACVHHGADHGLSPGSEADGPPCQED